MNIYEYMYLYIVYIYIFMVPYEAPLISESYCRMVAGCNNM